jgi:hypothetical protein
MLEVRTLSLLERVLNLIVHVNPDEARERRSHFEKVLFYFEMEQRETKKAWNAIVIEPLLEFTCRSHHEAGGLPAMTKNVSGRGRYAAPLQELT